MALNNTRNFYSPVAFLLVSVLITNLVFACVLIPTKEAKAIPVEETNPLVWLYNAISAVLEKITSWASAIMAGIKIWEKAETIAKDIFQAVLLAFLQRLLTMITNEIIKWINGGGEPKFISDWGSFLRDAANVAGADFLQQLGLGFLCQPFALQIKLALMPSGGFQQYARCTLQDMGRNLQNFFSNFSAGGGWNTWLQVIQPQNNFYGAYLMALDEKTRRELEAREKAKNEGLASGGFLGDKICERCHVTNTETSESMIFETAEGCGQARTDSTYSFVCLKETIRTPGSVVQYETQRVVDYPRELMQQQIAAITATLGPTGKFLAPFLTAITNALLNRVIQLGLGAVSSAVAGGDPSYGPTFSNPNYSLPSDNTVEFSDLITEAEDAIVTVPDLNKGLALQKENVESLLSQQQSNLSVLNSIKSTQIQTLEILKDFIENNCSMPAGVTSEILSDDGATQVVKFTVSGVGTITIQKSSFSATIQETTAAIQPQIDAMQLEINATQQWISDIDSAASLNETAKTKAEEYEAAYSSFSVSTALETEFENAYNAAVNATKIAVKSEGTSLSELLPYVQPRIYETIQKTNETEAARESLNSQLSSAQAKLSEFQTALSTCIALNQEQQL